MKVLLKENEDQFHCEDQFEDEEQCDGDPLVCLNYEVLERIFSYLQAPDLIVASTVSKPWYDYIAESRPCMNKITLSIDNGFNTATKDMLINSKRKYTNININYSYIESILNDIVEILSIRRFNFKVVKFNCIVFPQMSLFNYFMFLIEKKVEILHINFFCITEEDEPIQPFNFLKLKYLNIIPQNYRSQMATIDGAFIECRKLTYFGTMQLFDSKLVYDLMKNNKNLKSLLIRSENVIDIFKHDVAHKFDFRLKELRVMQFDYSTTAVNTHFNKFLRLQSADIEALELGTFFGCEIFSTIINCMRKLRKVDLVTDFDPNVIPEWMLEPFQPNPSIVHVSFQNKWKQYDITRAFLDGTTNLITLNLGTMDQGIMEYVNYRFGGTLRELKVGQFGALNFNDRSLFKKLESVTIVTPIIDEIKLVLSIARNRTHFEVLLINALHISVGDEKFIQTLINSILVKSVMRCGHRCLCY
ncbi:unnamed protein product [Diamesa serratosioi]